MSWTDITRIKYRRDGLRYASDTTDEEWALIERTCRQGFGLAVRARPECVRCSMQYSTSLKRVASGGCSPRTFRRSRPYRVISTSGAADDRNTWRPAPAPAALAPADRARPATTASAPG